MIDYEMLLSKYIKHVIAMEGSDFLPWSADDDFSEEELENLHRLSIKPD